MRQSLRLLAPPVDLKVAMSTAMIISIALDAIIGAAIVACEAGGNDSCIGSR